MATKDPYDVLGVPRGCDQDAITVAYRRLSQQVHPDRTVGLPEPQRRRATEQMVALNQAYARIGSSSARRQYDLEAQAGVHTPPTARVFEPDPDEFDAPITLHPQAERTGCSSVVQRPAALAVIVILLLASIAGYGLPGCAPRASELPAIAPSADCWFVEVASTPVATPNLDWAQQAMALDSDRLPMYFVSHGEWPAVIPQGTVLAGALAATQPAGRQLLLAVQRLGISDPQVRAMPGEVCASLAPFH